jgi:hypothetical protein
MDKKLAKVLDEDTKFFLRWLPLRWNRAHRHESNEEIYKRSFRGILWVLPFTTLMGIIKIPSLVGDKCPHI